eukprot:6193005-Alexandrium_andersonii.AAC.1
MNPCTPVSGLAHAVTDLPAPPRWLKETSAAFAVTGVHGSGAVVPSTVPVPRLLTNLSVELPPFPRAQ